MNRCAVIMAGGSGTRLWPLSRRNRPKQLLRIVEGCSLIYKAFERLNAAFSPEEIYVIALAEHLPAIAEELPALPPENLIGEPTGRDTANAIALAAAILHEKDPETIMGVFTADHVIRPTDKFVEIVKRGFAAAQEDPTALVTFGIKPTEPHTGLGYVERGQPQAPGVWTVNRFREKPDLKTAREYVASGNYYWNSGMFVWRTDTILGELRRHLPESHDAARRIAKAWPTEAGPTLARDLYPNLDKISIDYAVMEKAESVLVVEMALDWLDVGNWTALPAVLGTDSFGNTQALQRAAGLSSKNNILVAEGDHIIATIGVEDLVIVHSPDATLVCHKDQVQRIKDLVAQLDRDYDGHYA
jgi:mannose-1-phosphate guanylyltransferase